MLAVTLSSNGGRVRSETGQYDRGATDTLQMLDQFINLHLALAMTPIAGALAARELLARRRGEADLAAREQRVTQLQQEAMRAMQEAQREADAARRTREEFLERMHHELRTPLNAVIGLSRVLEGNKPGNQRPEDLVMLNRVRESGELLLRLVENVLDHSDLARGDVVVDREPVDVAAVTSRLCAERRNAVVARGLRLVTVLPATAPTVPLDARRFRQVLDHLFDNALKFTARGSIRVVLVTDAATGRPARLSVADTGIGIPPDRMDRIFEPFEQVDTSTARSYGGPGLGLPLARRLCHAMGCQLVAESRVGAGSRFTVVFPRD